MLPPIRTIDRAWPGREHTPHRSNRFRSDTIPRPQIAILDDYQQVALGFADWDRLDADVRVFHEPMPSEDRAAELLAPFEVVSLMRERTPFPASLIERLPRLRLLSMTGYRTTSLDVDACTRRGVLVTSTTNSPSDATAELAIGLILGLARSIHLGARNMADGRWLDGMPVGQSLKGQVLGILGLGKLGSRVAAVGRSLGMEVLAWSPNLTEDRAAAAGAALARDKAELFGRADVVSLHLVLSDRTRGIVGRPELAAMKEGGILVNTARALLVDQDALLDALQAGRIRAGLDVHHPEPLPPDHPLRRLPNVLLTPHLGYVVQDMYECFYREGFANIAAFLAGAPTNVVNPEARNRAGG